MNSIVEKLECSNCGYRNDMFRRRQGCAECTASLTDAKIVDEAPPQTESPEPEDEPSPSSKDGSISAESRCTCATPISTPENPHLCQYCDGLIVTAQRETAEFAGEKRAVAAQVTLAISGVCEIAVGVGMVVGRERTEMVPRKLMDLLSNAAGVSRKHAWFGSDEDYLYIVDLGSRNGTWVDYERLTPLALHRYSRDSLPAEVHLGGKVAFYVRCGESA